MKKIIILTMFVFTMSANAANSMYVKVTGKITSMDEKTVTIKSEKGEVKVPKDTIAGKSDIRPGKMVMAKATWKQIYENN